MQVASWGAYLLKRKIITMSFAPRDSHGAHVQLALERGVPAVIGVLGTIKLPYPSRAFDMVHCSECMIPWTSNGMPLECLAVLCSRLLQFMMLQHFVLQLIIHCMFS